MTPEQAAALRAPFPPEAIGKIPKGGTWLDYVGHAAVTDRLLQVDPEWKWTPAAGGEMGNLLITQRGNDSVMWIELTVCGVSRYGVGIVPTKSFELEKQLISDAIRNAAMRFGVALDLWSKEDLHASSENAEGAGSRAQPDTAAARPSGTTPLVPGNPPSAPTATMQRLLARAIAINDIDRVYKTRMEWQLPPVEHSDEKQLVLWGEMLTGIEKDLERPFISTSLDA